MSNIQLANLASPYNNLSDIRNIITLKLNRENYLIWKTLMVHYLRGQDLFRYVDGPSSCPSSTIARNAWIQQDQIILSALISTLSYERISLVIGAETSLELWNKLQASHMSNSHEILTRTKNKLSSLRKVSYMTLYEYYGKLKLLAAELAEIGEPLSESELIAFFLRGLDHSYDTIVISIKTKKDPPTLDAVYNLVACAETRILNSITDSTQRSAAFVNKLTQIRNLPRQESSGKNRTVEYHFTRADMVALAVFGFGVGFILRSALHRR